MRYGLMICLPGASKEIAGYSKIPGFDNLNENALTDIIRFTTSFKNHTEIINFLKDTEILPEQYQNGYLNIALFKGKNEISFLPYGIPFDGDKKFYNINYLKFHFAMAFRNLNFMEHFISEFYDPLKDVPIYREDLRRIREGFEIFKKEKAIMTEAISSMENFVKIYSTRKNNEGKYIINFLNMHKLVMFTSLYRNRPLELVNTPSDLNAIKMQIQHYQELIENGENEEIYVDKINELESELEFLTNFYRGGRK